MNNDEEKEYNYYGTLQNAVYNIAKLNQSYQQQFYSSFYRLQLTFEEMERAETIKKDLLTIPADANSLFEKKDLASPIISKLLTAETFFDDEYNEKRDDLSDCLEWLHKTLAYFYSGNFIQKTLFEMLDVSFMNDVLFDTSDMEKSIDKLNKTYSNFVPLQKKSIQNKLNKFYCPITIKDHIPDVSFKKQLLANLDLNNGKYFETMTSIQDVIFDLTDKVLEKVSRNGKKDRC